MPRTVLTEDEVRAETDRLIGVLEWAKSDEGIAYHTENKCTSHRHGILMGLLEDLMQDAVDQGYNPAYLLGALALRLRGQNFDQQHRDDLDALMNFDAWNKIKLLKSE